MVNYDLHIHTHLSACASREAFMADYIKTARELGLDLIGFADHAWDSTVEGASPWYAPQSYQRLLARRNELRETDTAGIKVLLGAEGEYAQGLLAAGEGACEFVDYILIPHSHTHMKGFVLPTDCIGNPEKHAAYLVNSFISLCNHKSRDLFFGIVHPMTPCGEAEEYKAKIYSFIIDSMLEECALAAKENGVFLEVNLAEFKKIPPEGLAEHCYQRFYKACLGAGCDFFLGSDAHGIKALTENHSVKERVIQSLGLTESGFKTAKHRIQNG